MKKIIVMKKKQMMKVMMMIMILKIKKIMKKIKKIGKTQFKFKMMEEIVNFKNNKKIRN